MTVLDDLLRWAETQKLDASSRERTEWDRDTSFSLSGQEFAYGEMIDEIKRLQARDAPPAPPAPPEPPIVFDEQPDPADAFQVYVREAIKRVGLQYPGQSWTMEDWTLLVLEQMDKEDAEARVKS